ncbi:hypothetical protein SAV31267_097670 [Streptomyces avermitilis]|uniref:Uncharacterized protein n=1 Tax=Streptomyces avermitilis TaxID=33903 RepID=A0A4D4N6T7_STRAX|nr:hypothetical protein SAV31267_097670 [Streptomyces avermitilis]
MESLVQVVAPSVSHVAGLQQTCLLGDLLHQRVIRAAEPELRSGDGIARQMPAYVESMLLIHH